MGKPRGRKGSATRQAIIDAAADILSEQGYDGLTIKGITSKLGISLGGPYIYFSNRAEVAASVINCWSEDFVESFEAALASSPSDTLTDAVRAIIIGHIRAQQSTSELHAFIYDLAPRIGLEDQVRGVSVSSANLIETHLRAVAQEIDSTIDLADAASAIETLLLGLAFQTRMLPNRQPTAVTSAVVDLITHYLACRE